MFRLLAVGDVEMRADELERVAFLVALDFRDRPDPAHLAVARPDDAIFRLIEIFGAGKRIDKALLDRLSIVGMKAFEPLLMGFVRRARRKAVQMQIFRRPTAAETMAQIDLKAADAADSLNPRELQLAIPQRLIDFLAIGRIAKRHADAVGEREGAHLMIAIGPDRRIAAKFLLGALRHRQPVSALEFRAKDFGRHLPKEPAR